MKTTIMVLSVVLLSAGTAFGAVKLQKSEEFATVGIGADMLVVHKIKDGAVTCYVTKHAKLSTNSISCLK